MSRMKRYALLIGLALAMPSWPTAWCGEGSSIKIGIFIPTRGERAPEGQAVRRGAEMAAAKVNSGGGIGGRPLHLVVGSADVRWEASTGELVRLIYNEDVWAVLGAVDGKSAHLAEQVVARARGRVIFVTPWATDATLTQIKIPWFFRTVPDDRQQAAALTREIFEVRRLRRVAVIAEGQYDARMASEAFIKAAAGAGTVTLFQSGDDEESWTPLVERLRRSGAEGWVIFGRPTTAAAWVHRMRKEGLGRPLFGPLALACPEFLKQAGGAVKEVVLVTSGDVQGPAGEQFRREFEKTYGDSPQPSALYAYDGLMALAEAIRKAGLNREALRETLARVNFTGVTGPVAFDRSGNRRGRVEVGHIR